MSWKQKEKRICNLWYHEILAWAIGNGKNFFVSVIVFIEFKFRLIRFRCCFFLFLTTDITRVYISIWIYWERGGRGRNHWFKLGSQNAAKMVMLRDRYIDRRWEREREMLRYLFITGWEAKQCCLVLLSTLRLIVGDYYLVFCFVFSIFVLFWAVHY